MKVTVVFNDGTRIIVPCGVHGKLTISRLAHRALERYNRRSGNDTTLTNDDTHNNTILPDVAAVSSSASFSSSYKNAKIIDVCTSQGAYLDMYDYVCDVVEDKDVLYPVNVTKYKLNRP